MEQRAAKRNVSARRLTRADEVIEQVRLTSAIGPDADMT
jgi:hypothetical protein